MNDFDPIVPQTEAEPTRGEIRSVLRDPDLRRVLLQEPPRPKSPKPSLKKKRKQQRQNRKANR